MAGEDERPKGQSGPKGFRIVGEGDSDASSEQGRESAPPITFGAFALSLSASALVHLGEALRPDTGETGDVNLPLAQQTIDILAMLSEKTQGNLDDEEKRLLEGLLHDLRLRYVRVRSGSKD